jgi:hypothetical protein
MWPDRRDSTVKQYGVMLRNNAHHSHDDVLPVYLFCHSIKFVSGLLQQSPPFPTDGKAIAKQAASAINLAFAEGGGGNSSPSGSSAA